MKVASCAGRLFGSAGLPSERKRRELRFQARRLELEDRFRASQILQPVHTQIPERGGRRKRVAHQRGHGFREQNLDPLTPEFAGSVGLTRALVGRLGT